MFGAKIAQPFLEDNSYVVISWVGNDVGFLSFSDSKCCWLDTLQSKNSKLWPLSIKFDELIYNNVNNTFTKKGQMARQPSSLLLSANIVAEPCFRYKNDLKLEVFNVFKTDHVRGLWMAQYWTPIKHCGLWTFELERLLKQI